MDDFTIITNYILPVATTAAAILDDQNNIIGVRRAVSYMNRTSSNISVSEMGTYMRASYGTSGFPADFLIERTVLSTPEVVEPWALITVEFDMLY